MASKKPLECHMQWLQVQIILTCLVPDSITVASIAACMCRRRARFNSGARKNLSAIPARSRPTKHIISSCVSRRGTMLDGAPRYCAMFNLRLLKVPEMPTQWKAPGQVFSTKCSRIVSPKMFTRAVAAISSVSESSLVSNCLFRSKSLKFRKHSTSKGCNNHVS